jgi:hypothetical protein
MPKITLKDYAPLTRTEDNDPRRQDLLDKIEDKPKVYSKFLGDI